MRFDLKVIPAVIIVLILTPPVLAKGHSDVPKKEIHAAASRELPGERVSNVHTDVVRRFLVSGDGKVLVTIGSDGRVNGIDLATNKSRFDLKYPPGVSHIGDVTSVSHDGKFVVSQLKAIDEKGERIWRIEIIDTETGKNTVIAELPDFKRTMVNPVIADDGKSFWIMDYDGLLSEFEIPSGKRLRQIGYADKENSPSTFALSRDGKHILRGKTGYSELIDISANKIVKYFKGITQASFSPNGKSLVASGPEGTLLYQLGSDKVQVLPRVKPSRSSFSFDKSGNDFLEMTSDGSVLLTSAIGKGSERFNPTGVDKDKSLSTFRLNEAGNRITMVYVANNKGATDNGAVQWIDVHSGKVLDTQTFPYPSNGGFVVGIADDGASALYSSEKGEVRRLNLKAKK